MYVAGPGIEPATYGSSVRLPTTSCCLHICAVMASEKYDNQGVPLENYRTKIQNGSGACI